jgi:cell division protein FtsB
LDERGKQSERGKQRMPFFLLLCGLLGGALVCALVISTALAEGSFQITHLQQANTALAKQRQLLREEVAAAQSAQVIQARARQLGMLPAGELRFLNLKTGKIQADPGSGAVRAIHVPGYTP